MRLFVALDIEENLKEKVLEAQRLLEPESKIADIRFVEKKNFHLTLKFLGEVNDNSVNDVLERVRSISMKAKPFRISISGLSYFGSGKSVRVIFLDVVDGKDDLIGLEKRLSENLKGFREENYDLHPHLTIARVGFVKEPREFLEKIESLKSFSLGEMEAKEIKLFKSILTRKGPIYAEVEKFPLTG